MKSKIKIILLVLAICLLSFSLGLFFLAKKIEPVSIKEEALEILQKSSPEFSFSIEEVDYSLGMSVSLYLKNLTASQDGKTIAHADWIEFKLPLWAIYFGGGSLEIRVVNSNIKETNAKIKVKELTIDRIHKNLERQKIELPEIFIRNKVNIRFSNFIYEDEMKYHVDVLLFKDIAKSGVSAFEIIKNNGKDSLNPYQLQVVGEIDLTKLFESNETSISFFANINNLKLHEGRVSLPDIKFSGKGELNSLGELKTSVELKANDLLQMQLNASLTQKLWKFDQVRAKLDLKSTFKASLYKGRKFSFDDSFLNMEGGFDYMPIEEDIDLDLKFEVSKVNYALDKGISILNSVQGHLIGKKIKAKVKSDLFKGVAVTDLEADMDFKSGYKLNKMANLELNTSFSNIRLSKNEINTYLYKNIKNKKTFDKRLLLPKISWNIEGKHIFIDDAQYSFKGKLEHESSKILITNALIKNLAGELSIKGEGIVQNSDFYQLSLNGFFKNFNLSNIIFLAPTWMQADASGKLNGKYHLYLKHTDQPKDFSFKYNGDLDNGSLKAYNLVAFYEKKYPGNAKIQLLNTEFKNANLDIVLNTQKTSLEALFDYSKKEKLTIQGDIMHSPSNRSFLEVFFGKKTSKNLLLTFDGLGKNLSPVL